MFLPSCSGVRKQERTMTMKKILDESRMEKKKARNAITALGHFLTLVIQVGVNVMNPLQALLQIQ